MDYKFTELVNISELQELINRFDKTPYVAFGLIDTDRTILASSDLSGICSEFNGTGKSCEDTYPETKVTIEFFGTTKSECRIYRCDSGLVSIEIPVIFKGKYLATAISDQFFFWESCIDDFNEYEKCAFPDTFHTDIPMLSKIEINEKVDCFIMLTNLLLKSGFRALNIKNYESEIEAYEKESFRGKEKLESLEKMKCDLVSSLSHELKTPLAIIKGYTELLYDDCLGPMDKNQKKALDSSLLNVNKLERIVDSLLYLGMEHSNEHFYERNPLNMLDIIEASTVCLSRALVAKDLRIQTNYPDRVPIICGDGKKLFQVLSHMLDNAIKFSPSGSTITIYVRETAEHLHLSIQDRGVGIIEEQLSRIFDGFFQGDSSLTRKYPGIGLGLNICQRIIQHHEGYISVESEVNKGSTFHIKLPLKNNFKNGICF